MNICELLENSSTQSSEDDVNTAIEREPEKKDLKTNTQITDDHSRDLAVESNDESYMRTLENDKGYDKNNVNYKNENFDQILSESPVNSEQENQTSQDNSNTKRDSTEEKENDEANSDYNRTSQKDSNEDKINIDFGHSILTSNSAVDDELNFDRLGPFEKLCFLCDNPTPSNMEGASKFLIPALEFCSTQEDFMRVFSYLRKYCFFSDVLLRSLWLEQIQNIIQYIHQEGDNISVEFKDNFNIPNELALLISDLMHEPTYQVKKYSTASLICIVERQLLNNEQIEVIIIPSLLSLVKENNEDFHIDCISLFGKLAPLIGQELTSKYFLEPFCRLCTSPVFHTRKACASNITEIANVVSTEEVEKYLIPHFCDFMNDQVWAIRKVCADIFSLFAIKCKRKTREKVLTDYFIRLLDDNSRWVKISAYKSLGSFIATFSKQNGSEEVDESEDEELDNEKNISEEANSEVKQKEEKKKDSSEKPMEQSGTESISPKKEGEYSNFIYWRNSIPSLDDTNESVEEKKKSESENLKTISSTSNLATESKTNTIESIQISSKSPIISNTYGQMNASYNNLFSSSNSLYQSLQQQANSRSTDISQVSEELKQDVVPSTLLSYFITMVEMNAQNSLDAEMNYNCAFNFPAIALTLGPSNWKFVKDLYKKLAEDNNWKVRQTLAYSIHELAIILGTECTQTELVPVFDSFIKDVDEVRMGIVSNLSKFLRVLSIESRRAYMPKLNDFLKMDNQRNWRFRNELGLQIAEFCELFPTDCIAEYIQPVAFILALDKVAEVRVTSIKALTVILKQFEINNDEKYRKNFLDDVIRTFADNNKWSFRQLFVFLCKNIFKEKAYSSYEALSRDILPKLLSLRNDVVANIRVCLARVISTYILNIQYFTSSVDPISSELEITVNSLSKDKESDVRSYFGSCDEYNDSNYSSLPPYEDVVNLTNKQNKEQQNNQTDCDDNKNNLKEYEIQNDCRLNDSLNLINAQVISYNNTDDVEIDEEDDEEDDDEIIDTTKVGQLKIVNEVDNDMEDDSDEIIDTSSGSPLNIDPIPLSTKIHPESTPTSNISYLIDKTKISETASINFQAPLADASNNELKKENNS